MDDTTTGTTDDDVTKDPVPIEEKELTIDKEAMVKRIEDIIQFFLALLQVTGGDFVPEKCVWYLIADLCNKGVPTLQESKSTRRGININSKPIGTISAVKRKAVSQGHRTLGFHLCGDGTSRAHKKVMKEKAIKYGEAIMSSSLKSVECTMAYNRCYMLSLGYGTAATSLSMDECKEIQKPPVNAILIKMGINRNTKIEVVFGTAKYGGLGMDHLAAIQGYGQLQYLVGYLRSDDTSGTLNRILMEFTQLECGMEEVLRCDFDKYEKNILTPNWITECWILLNQCDSTIETTGTWKPLRVRKGDVALMEVFTNNNLTAKEMKDINRCRMCLKVFYLSDVTDIAGQDIESCVIKGKRYCTRSSKWESPIQQRPPTAACKVWNKAIKDTFTEEEDITHQLGGWYDEGRHQQT
jgi:hypothetical protein